jgi:2-dehydro-3-deoxyphosphooctonate aldolase (KDO 8-P synthase)
MKIIAGPCQHENFDLSLEVAETCKNVCKKYDIEYIFKSSFDKANRSHLLSKRGISFERWFEDFDKLRNKHGFKTLTDIHETYQVSKVVDVIDVLQIPAFLSRQTDLIIEACKSGKIVNIKKGQFLSPSDIKNVLSKCDDANEIWITERGTSFGYNNLVVDFTGLDYMLKNYNVPIFFDVTHSVQTPGGSGSSSGGNRDYVPGLSRAGSALGIQNFFLEVHPNPDNSPSDGPNSVKLSDFEKIIDDIVTFNYKIS